MQSFKIKPPAYLLIALVVASALGVFLPVMMLIPLPWNLLGVLPLALGIIINIYADQIFHQADTPVCPFEVSSTLIINGPYRLTRNPMYLGFMLALFGVAVLLRSVTPYLMVIAFGLLMDRMFIRMEEQKLAARFGAEWAEYKRRTRRWL